ncbi:MAG: carbohydrate porin [Kordiimonadaceae bacterium]|nr:carbohydrate porin [Kordiimonadaceae bacterium]
MKVNPARVCQWFSVALHSAARPEKARLKYPHILHKISISLFIGLSAVTSPVTAEETAKETAVTFGLDYTSEVWTVASGGIKKGQRYLDNINASISKGWANGTNVYVSGLYNNGHSLSGDLVGDAQVISNIEAPVKAARLYEAWVEHPFGQTGINVKVGLLDVNTEFDVLEAAGLFLGSAHGIGTDIGQSGENGPAIFPVTALGARLQLPLAEKLTLRAALLDGAPGDPNHPKRTAIKLGGGDGAFLIGELDYALPAGKIIAGLWRYTASSEAWAGAATQKNAGAYVRAEHKIAGPSATDKGLYAFARLGFADADINVFSSFYSLGLQYIGLFTDDAKDMLGLAVATATTSKEYRQVTIGAPKRETALELTYKIEATPWLSLQPDVQYIINPLEGVKNTLTIGLRAIFTLQ